MLGNYKNKEKSSSSNQGLLNLIGPGTEIKGDLICEGDIRIDGRVDGTIKVGQRIVIGDSGIVNGNIQADNAIIAGFVNGNIKAIQSTLLHGKSIVKGDIYTSQIIIESGASFNGRCVMDTNQQTEQSDARVEE
jgi:cytoskeletal protein CcmA (bactofilin family)